MLFCGTGSDVESDSSQQAVLSQSPNSWGKEEVLSIKSYQDEEDFSLNVS
jgi:hypothetical protein